MSEENRTYTEDISTDEQFTEVPIIVASWKWTWKCGSFKIVIASCRGLVCFVFSVGGCGVELQLSQIRCKFENRKLEQPVGSLLMLVNSLPSSVVCS